MKTFRLTSYTSMLSTLHQAGALWLSFARATADSHICFRRPTLFARYPLLRNLPHDGHLERHRINVYVPCPALGTYAQHVISTVIAIMATTAQVGLQLYRNSKVAISEF